MFHRLTLSCGLHWRSGAIRWIALSLLFSLGLDGCRSVGQGEANKTPGNRIVCFVPGVSGDDLAYAGLKSAIREMGNTDLRVVSWGARGPLFMLNFQNASIHNAAEKKLADLLTDWMRKNPAQQIDLVGHSAGGGVILGALRRLGEDIHVNHVVLLSPSVSPGYPLEQALGHMRRLDAFYSDRDTVFLKWRTSTFGTYDNVRTAAAGNLGFHPVNPLPPNLADKLVQHPYDPRWASLGNDGGHPGSAARDFVRAVVVPLLSN